MLALAPTFPVLLNNICLSEPGAVITPETLPLRLPVNDGAVIPPAPIVVPPIYKLPSILALPNTRRFANEPTAVMFGCELDVNTPEI